MEPQKDATARAAGCAACNHMHHKCPPDCIFAPYFPATSPSFDYVHRVYGCSNVGKILQSLPVEQRRMAAESLTFEAEARIRDPVLGCVGYIYLLQQHLAQIDRDIQEAEAQIYTAGYQPPPLPPPLEQHWYQMPQLTTMTMQPHHEQSDDFPYPIPSTTPQDDDRQLMAHTEVQDYAVDYQPPQVPSPLEQHWYQMPQLMTVPPHHEQSDDFLYPTVAAYPSMPQAEPFPHMPQSTSELLPITSTPPQNDPTHTEFQDYALEKDLSCEIPSTMPQQDEMTETEIQDYATMLEDLIEHQ